MFRNFAQNSNKPLITKQ